MATANSTAAPVQSAPVGTFTHPGILLVTPKDDRASLRFPKDPTRCYGDQDQEGPTILTIGPDATHSALASTAERYGIPLADLLGFRARQR